MPDARAAVLPDTGHMPFIERQQRFDREAAEFLANFAERQ